MTPRAALLAVFAAACGRVAFDPLGGDGGTDASDAEAGDGTSVLGCPADAVLCETFDSGFSAWSDGLLGGFAQSVPSPRGSALCIETTSDVDASLINRNFTAVTSGALHVRMFVTFPAAGFTTTGQFDLLHIGQSPLVNATHVSMNGAGGNITLDVETTSRSYSPGTGVDRWACIEIALMVANTDGTATLSIDDVSRGATPPGDTLPVNGWSILTLGIDAYSGTPAPPARACFDEIIVARSQIGCMRTAAM